MTAAILAGIGVFLLLILIGLLDYRRICRRDEARFRAELPERHIGKPRLP